MRRLATLRVPAVLTSAVGIEGRLRTEDHHHNAVVDCPGNTGSQTFSVYVVLSVMSKNACETTNDMR